MRHAASLAHNFWGLNFYGSWPLFLLPPHAQRHWSPILSIWNILEEFMVSSSNINTRCERSIPVSTPSDNTIQFIGTITLLSFTLPSYQTIHRRLCRGVTRTTVAVPTIDHHYDPSPNQQIGEGFWSTTLHKQIALRKLSTLKSTQDYWIYDR